MAGLVDQGVDGIVVTGTTGETSTLTDTEKLQLVTAGKQVAAGKAKIITWHAIRDDSTNRRDPFLAQEPLLLFEDLLADNIIAPPKKTAGTAVTENAAIDNTSRKGTYDASTSVLHRFDAKERQLFFMSVVAISKNIWPACRNYGEAGSREELLESAWSWRLRSHRAVSFSSGYVEQPDWDNGAEDAFSSNERPDEGR
jgi:hypothetical protein